MMSKNGFLKGVRRRCFALMMNLGLEDLPEDNIHVQRAHAYVRDRMQRLEAIPWKDLDCLAAEADRLEKAVEIFMLAAQARGEIRGPVTVAGLEEQAKGAESLAKMFVGKDDPEAAERQLERAHAFRVKAVELQRQKMSASQDGATGGDDVREFVIGGDRMG